ncbi:enamine deaminase RidA (YjgF/YER057c/UK114 family) [Kitasatospora gansuensis]|uniref:Enamine deaminase RidA (YjgF/YER057c/UK114 family) n=1 Tax=Kitasatospora gansuensis TaxID=258050 RepID=A0A7W7S5Z1_9ACTN|nr:RidA family protein [Kitasatospora gansuensis]MBB4944524.1 enamine deaminase RidA (YjgF/YER057c/UK114 family) [Kitasatospora gansuensis]
MIQRFGAGKRMSEAVVHNGTVYLAGQVADDIALNVEGQTKAVLAGIDRLLAEAGSDKSKVLRAEIFLADIKDFDAMNLAWDAWVPADAAPARATVQAPLYRPEVLVEILVTAAL